MAPELGPPSKVRHSVRTTTLFAPPAIRALFNAQFGSRDVVRGLVAMTACALLSIGIASRTFNRATA